MTRPDEHPKLPRKPQDKKPCGANKKDGTKCRKPGKENGRCRWHGGNTPHGPASANWKHGRYSKYLPSGLTEKYRQGMNDPDLLSQRAELALIDSHIFDVLESTTFPGPKAWQDIQQALDAADKELRGYAPDSYRTLSALLRQSVNASGSWREIYTWIELRRRVAEGERKRLVDLQQMVTVEQALGLITQVVEVVNEYVSDRKIMAAIGLEIRSIVSRRANVEALPEPGSGT